ISNFRFGRSDDGGKLADAAGELAGGGSLDGKRHINSHYSPSHIETSCLITSMSAKVSPSAMWLARTSMTRSASTSVTQTHRVTASSGMYATTFVVEPYESTPIWLHLAKLMSRPESLSTHTEIHLLLWVGAPSEPGVEVSSSSDVAADTEVPIPGEPDTFSGTQKFVHSFPSLDFGGRVW